MDEGFNSVVARDKPRCTDNQVESGTWWQPLVIVSIGCLFYWCSLPPFRQPWAAYLSAFFLSAAVYWPNPLKRRDYVRIWLISCVLWLSLLQGIRLAYWPLYAGWVALSLYVAVYIPAFIAIARSLRHQYGVPFPFACSIAWTGLELFRAYFVTGFSACMLGHSQTPWPVLLQIAAMLGTYGISFLIMLVGASACFLVATYCERNCQSRPRRLPWELQSTLSAVFWIVVWISGSYYSYSKHNSKIEAQKPIKPIGRFLVIQDNMPTMFEMDVDGLRESWFRHANRTIQQLQADQAQTIDVVLWPESTFGIGTSWLEWDGKTIDPQVGDSIEQMRDLESQYQHAFRQQTDYIYSAIKRDVSIVAGGGVVAFENGSRQVLNSALHITSATTSPEFYGKRHLVMFGEYIPLLSMFPELQSKFGIGTMNSGSQFVCWKTRTGATMAPSICFEDVVPQFIQQQVRDLENRNQAPDVLINLTNDAWFRGSSILDHHLNNAICAAVENRRPVIVAANSGISAWIDGSGHVVQSLGRFEAGSFIAEPIPDGRKGLWQRIGDWPARILCFISFWPFAMFLFQRSWSIVARLRPTRKLETKV